MSDIKRPATGGTVARADIKSREPAEDIHTTGQAQDSNRLPVLAEEIRREHHAARRASGEALRHAIAAGERLIEAKALLEHGQWLPWLAEQDIPERTARLYARIARHKDIIDAKSATVADMTLRGAVAELTEPKWPEKISERYEAQRLLPLAGHVRIGLREDAAGWDEVWLAPSYQHSGFIYVTHIWTPRTGNSSVTGGRRPIRADFVHAMVAAHLSVDFNGIKWQDRPCPAWAYNMLLFPDADTYINSVDDLEELVEIAQDKAPAADFPAHVRQPVSHSEAAPRPLCEMVFGAAEQSAA